MRHAWYIIILCCFVGCSGIDKPKKPKNLIDKESMSAIMYDLYILNAAKGVNRKILESNGVMPLEYIYNKYKIDSLQFAESNTYYAYDSEVYKSIVEKVKKDLENQKDVYEKLNVAEQKATDSINALRKKETDTLTELDSILP